MVWLAAMVLMAPQDPGILVRNPAGTTREEVVRVSLPLPRGAFRKLPWVKVAERFAPAVPLLRWPDGSLAVVQIQPRVSVPAGSRRRFRVDLRPDGPPPKPVPTKWFLQDAWPLRTELEDPWGTVYTARLVPDPTAGPGGLLRATSRVRVRRFRSVHRSSVPGSSAQGPGATGSGSKGAGSTGSPKGSGPGEKTEARSFFGLIAYLTTFAGERRAELTLVLDNNAHLVGPVIGPARFRRFTLVVEDETLLTRPRFIVENGLRPPKRVDGAWRQTLLGPSDQLYLGDATAKAFRFDLFLDDPKVEKNVKEAARLAVAHPLQVTPDLVWTRHTGAFGAHGGPAPGPSEETPESVWMRHRWGMNATFGPFGGFGDTRDAAANGTPRNGPSALHNVIRFASGALLASAEGMVLQQCLRPTPGQAVRLPKATVALRRGLTKRTMRRPHGFTANDYEHFSVGLLFDYYWLTGDALARDELARLGRGLPAVWKGLPFQTCRGEGWCMQAAVLIARATGDDTVLRLVHERFVEEIEPSLGTAPSPYVIRQPPHRDAFDGTVAFDCPWQMAALVHGAHAMFVQTGDARYAQLAVRCARVMAGVGWVEGKGPKYLVSASRADRYTMAVGSGPLEGTALMLVGGFVLASEMADKEADRQMFRGRAETIFAPYEKAERNRAAMNSWFQLFLDRRSRQR